MAANTTVHVPFQFKQFSIVQDQCAMPVNTDGVLLGAWVNTQSAASVLDIGTGTGVIALMLAQRLAEVKIEGVEIDPAAAAQARTNMAASIWADRLTCHQESIQDFSRFAGKEYDLIVSNPPFFTGGTLSENQSRSEVRHTVKLPHGDLIQAVRRLLSPGGRFALILPHIEGLRFIEMATTYGLHLRRQTEVRSREEKPVVRLLVEFSKEEGPLEQNQLILYQGQADRTRSTGYQALVEPFYL